MKKLFYLILCLFALVLVGCNQPQDEPADGKLFFEKCDALLISDATVKSQADVDFQTSFIVDDVLVDIAYSSDNQSVISNTGVVTFPDEEDATVKVTVVYSFYQKDGTLYESEGKVVTFTVLSKNSILDKVAEGIKIPEFINDNVDLPTTVEGYKVEWHSNKKCLSNKGVYTYVAENTNVTLTATIVYVDDNNKEYFYEKAYEVVVGPYDDNKCVELVSGSINLPKEFAGLKLPLTTENEYGVTVTWSSNSNYVDNTGKVINLTGDVDVVMTAVLTKGSASATLTFPVKVQYFEMGHMFVHEVADFDGEYDNTEVSNGKLVLKAGATEGTYTSGSFNTRDFTELVGSWNALTNAKATCEYAISVYAGGKWSRYFTYGDWGLGKENYYSNQDDTYVKMNTDEILLKESNVGTAVKFKVTLRRDSASTASPSLVRIAMTFLYSDYTYPVDVTGLPLSVDYDVPKLYQYDVPGIGGSICSPTTTTMLLKYHGVDVSSSYQYEHQYMASLVADPGHNNPTYGNWSYNMAAAGAFGRKAYVMKMYSWDELRYYLATSGPVGASIKGTFTSITGASYNTGGHLICVRGYRIENNKTIVICNDPAVKGTYYEVYLSTFLNCWRDTIYIVE